MLCLFTCSDDTFTDIEPIDPDLHTVYFDLNNLSDGPVSTIGQRKHILGPERENPFTVENMSRAAAIVRKDFSKSVATDRVASDLYIRFTPQDETDLMELEESGFFLLDFPLTRELIEAGDYYEEAESEMDYPELYTTVSVGTVLPDVPHTIINRLDLAEKDPEVIYTAYELTGNAQEFRDTYGEVEDLSYLCLENQDDTDRKELVEDYEPCRSGGGGTSPPRPSEFIENECGCDIYRNVRKPGGCVRVEDTQFEDFQAVRRVEVVTKNGWFTRRRVNTDDDGCWRVNKEFKGKSWFWVRFKDKVSNRGKIRFAGVRGWRFWQKAQTGKVSLGMKRGPHYHNIIIRFNKWDGVTRGTKTHYAWAGATVNNALHEFHDYARQEGFIAPPRRLNIMVGMKRRNGFATMMRQMGSHNFITAVNQGMGYWVPNAVGFSANDNIGKWLLTATRSYVWPQPSPIMNTFLGDVNIGVDFDNSDDVKRLAYHELGHASHFAGASINFYRGVISAEVGAFGHGNPGVSLAGHIQIAESWAEHMAITMVSQEYPSSVVLNNGLINDWLAQLEDVRNEEIDHIPIGVYNDLIDGVSLSERVFDRNVRVRTSTGTTLLRFDLIDPVDRAFTNHFFGRNMDQSIRTVDDLRRLCVRSRPSTVTETAINDLFQQY
jgi:hypothetical protein